MGVIGEEIRNLKATQSWEKIDSLCTNNKSDLSLSDITLWIRSRFMSGDYSGCLDLCSQFYEKSLGKERMALCLFRLRSIRKIEGDSAAFDYAKTIVEEFPDNIEIASMVMRRQFHLSDFQGCINKCRQIFLLDPVNHTALKFMARSHSRIPSSIDERETHWKSLTKSFPSDPEGHVGLARIFIEKREFVRAAEILDIALSLNPSYNPAVSTYSRLSGKLDSSREIGGSIPSAKMLFSSGLFDKLIENTQSLGDLQSLPNTELLWYLRALSQTGNYDLAKESFLEVFANRKFHENLYSNMARLAQVNGDFEFHKKMCIELLRTPDVSVVIRGINEFARSSVDDEELLQWSIEIFPHMSSEEKDFFLNELIENSRFKTILGFEEIRTSPKLSQYAILSSLRENSSTKIINEFLTNPLEFNISDRTFVPIFNHYYENEQYSIAESLVMNSHSWGISKKFTRATMHSLIFAMARELDLAKIQKLLSNFSILNIKIPRKVFERATTFFINSGGDAESFFSHVEDPMKNLVGGHSALFEMLSKCGFVDKADEIFTLALLRFLTDPINEDEFPDSVMSTGRREYVYELFYRLVDFPNVASENVDFIKKCEDLHFLAPGIFSNFSSEKFMDRNLIDSYIISNIIDECNYSPYDTVHSRKVIHVSNSIKKGGAERQVINCLGLANSDSSLAVWNISRNDEYNSYISDFQSLNLPIYDYSEDKTETSSFPPVIDALLRCLPVAPGLNPGFTKQVRNLTHLFQTEKPNVVHLWQDATNIAGGIAALIAGVPKIVMSARSSPPFPIPNTSIPEKGSVYFIHSRFTRGAYRKLLENPNVLLCHNSNIGAQLYCEWLEFPSNRSSEFHIIRNGFSFEINTTGETREKNFNHVGGIFRLKEVKRPMLWIKSAELMIRNGFKYNFTIVGDGPMMQKCKDYIVSKGLSERIKLVGFSDDVGSWLEKFDILLHTSAIEGLPNVLIEAQSYGVPVVATDAGGSRETFIDNVTGILCNDDSESISQTVSMALSNTDWISNARKQSAIWALDSFSISQMQATLLQMYGWSK